MAKRHAGDEATLAEIRKVMRGQVDLLGRYASVMGGWGYYDFKHHTKQPGGVPMSFTTATVLIGLQSAREAGGVEIPEALVKKALAAVKRQQIPDGSFAYAENSRMMPRRGINRPAGSLGRSLACFVAQAVWEDPSRNQTEDLETWLGRLFDRQLWLDMARKRPVPHESYFQVAGYFYYYAHYYGGLGDRPPSSGAAGSLSVTDGGRNHATPGLGRELVGFSALRIPPGIWDRFRVAESCALSPGVERG